jgi:rubrerythrin
MKLTIFTAALLAVGAIGFHPAQVSTQSHSISPTTRDHLNTAMHGEAFASAKYLLFAEQARSHGHVELANLFERAAQTERLEHFKEEAELAHLVGDDASNLRDAIKGESYEVDTMYREFAEQARAAGDHAAAARFEEIRRDEMRHRDEFKAALDRLTARPSGN